MNSAKNAAPGGPPFRRIQLGAPAGAFGEAANDTLAGRHPAPQPARLGQLQLPAQRPPASKVRPPRRLCQVRRRRASKHRLLSWTVQPVSANPSSLLEAPASELWCPGAPVAQALQRQRQSSNGDGAGLAGWLERVIAPGGRRPRTSVCRLAQANRKDAAAVWLRSRQRGPWVRPSILLTLVGLAAALCTRTACFLAGARQAWVPAVLLLSKSACPAAALDRARASRPCLTPRPWWASLQLHACWRNGRRQGGQKGSTSRVERSPAGA